MELSLKFKIIRNEMKLQERKQWHNCTDAFCAVCDYETGFKMLDLEDWINEATRQESENA